MSNSIPRILLLCATSKGYEVLKEIINKYPESLACASTFHEVNMQKSFYDAIITLCENNEIPVVNWTSIKEEPEVIIKRYNVDCLIAISWKYHINLDINHYLKHKIIVIHDSILPKYRGFASLPTAVIKGEKEVGISAIYAANKIDHGDIILQKKLIIGDKEYICDIINDVAKLYKDAVIELIENIRSNRSTSATSQDHSKATYSIWRDPDDCQIDWNHSSTGIYNLIRAVGYPYLGAFSFLGNEKIYIWKAQVIKNDIKFEIREPGKIWELDDLGQPIIVCGKGLLKITQATSNGRSLLPIKKLRQRFYFKNEV